jgi:DNA helicase HerA-like ATPase
MDDPDELAAAIDALFAQIRKHPAGDRPVDGLFVMDEAQTFARSGAMTTRTMSTIKLESQARKYGLGLVFATQAPKGLSNQISGNATTQFYDASTARSRSTPRASWLGPRASPTWRWQGWAVGSST